MVHTCFMAIVGGVKVKVGGEVGSWKQGLEVTARPMFDMCSSTTLHPLPPQISPFWLLQPAEWEGRNWGCSSSCPLTSSSAISWS